MERSQTKTQPHTPYHTVYSKEFYDNLTAACADAREKYPAEHKTLFRAANLILNGFVTRGKPGVFVVRSETQHAMVYAVNGRCPCQSAQYAPGHRCKHVWCKALYMRALKQSDEGHWFADHSENARDGRVWASAGADDVAVVCDPEHMQALALAGKYITPDGRAGLAERS